MRVFSIKLETKVGGEKVSRGVCESLVKLLPNPSLITGKLQKGDLLKSPDPVATFLQA